MIGSWAMFVAAILCCIHSVGHGSSTPIRLSVSGCISYFSPCCNQILDRKKERQRLSQPRVRGLQSTTETKVSVGSGLVLCAGMKWRKESISTLLASPRTLCLFCMEPQPIGCHTHSGWAPGKALCEYHQQTYPMMCPIYIIGISQCNQANSWN